MTHFMNQSTDDVFHRSVKVLCRQVDFMIGIPAVLPDLPNRDMAV